MVNRDSLTTPQDLSKELWKLNWAFIMFLIAGITDIIDGPLARRMNVTSSFGRMFDPLVDKILIVGGYIALWLFDTSITFIYWWMVLIIVAREVVVTQIRKKSESQGIAFGANWAGKLKMFLQSFAIGSVIIYMGYFQGETWAIYFRNSIVLIAVVFTAWTAINYVTRYNKLIKDNQK